MRQGSIELDKLLVTPPCAVREVMSKIEQVGQTQGSAAASGAAASGAASATGASGAASAAMAFAD